MKRTISLEAQAAVAHLRDNCGFRPSVALPSCGGIPPLAVLGIGPGIPSWSEVRQAFVVRIRQFPPDRNPEEFVHIVDAYDALKRYFRSLACEEEEQLTRSATKRRRVDAEASLNGHNLASVGALCAAAPKAVIAIDTIGVAHMDGRESSPTASSISIAALGNNVAPTNGYNSTSLPTGGYPADVPMAPTMPAPSSSPTATSNGFLGHHPGCFGSVTPALAHAASSLLQPQTGAHHATFS
eukprot:TRINITY_DN15629_c0_g1_i1.p1 TRINITY_DN15629_c0_g1~~TRINITY_DN15629_c0_g1_i1.p1  ORF type:complete len:240 (-),score=11.22 TRINITY_DN15629_c0_g1_i1:4-723(-)